MNDIIIVLTVADGMHFEISIPKPVHRAALPNRYGVALLAGNKRYILVEQAYENRAVLTVYSWLVNFRSDKVQLHQSIKDDIGYLWCEYLNDNDNPRYGFIRDGAAPFSPWVGERYLVWENVSTGLTTWLYEKNGNITCELTPTYPWAFLEPNGDEAFVSYEAFIKNYKPSLIFNISRECIDEWYSKITPLMRLIDNNEEKWRLQMLGHYLHERFRRIARLKRAKR